MSEEIDTDAQHTETDAAEHTRRYGLRRKRRRGERRLVSTAALPAMCTLLNGLSGFASIHFATKDALGYASLWNLEVAAWLILAAMFFDMLDGRLARLTHRTSDFGRKLDSLCDAVSFGVAPAMLMLRSVITAMRGHVERIDASTLGLAMERVIWCVAGLYMACAILRLARFNVETTPDESAHMDFRGLPSPGAAAAVTTQVLLFTYLADFDQGWRSSTWLLATVGIMLPVTTLITALLMVSRIRYPHVVNQYIRNRRPFGYLVKAVLVIMAGIINFHVTAAAAMLVFVLSGPVQATWRTIRQRSQDGGPPPQAATPSGRP